MPTLMDLLEAGAHFGHKKEKSSPQAKQFTYTIRDSIYVIDLEKTIDQLKKTVDFITKSIKDGKIILFVGTKRQAKDAVKKVAQSLDMPYMVERWPGGMLTNFETIRGSLKTLNDLDEKINSEEFQLFTKKERSRLQEKRNRLNLIFEGIKTLSRLPDVVFVVDTHKEKVAVTEANKKQIPIVGTCDTNSNPDLIDLPIPINDDSAKAIELILSTIEEEVKNGKKIDKEPKSDNIEDNQVEKELKAKPRQGGAARPSFEKTGLREKK